MTSPTSLTLTPMQQAAHRIIGQGHNLLLLSPTGSGKTLAYLLPLAQQVEASLSVVQAVVVVPSRELALQVENVLRQHAPQVRGMSLYGGRPTMEEHRRIKEIKPQIVVATPGRLIDHVGKDNLNILGCKTLVVDEYDKCLELGFRDEIDQIGRLFSSCKQVVLTSATRFDSAAQADHSEAQLLHHRSFKTLDHLDTAAQLRERLSHCLVPALEKDKLDSLARLLTHLGCQSSIVFVAHRESAERIGRHLASEGFAAVVYHGGLEQEQRERALYRFRAGAATTLVSTDLAARGLDIPQVSAIVHYHLPLDEATFTHRSGRTARWQDSGTAYLLLGPEEQLPPFFTPDEELPLADIAPKAQRPEWTVLYIGRGKKDKLSKADVLGFLCKKGGLKSRQIGRIDVMAHAAYVAVQRSAMKPLLQRVASEKIKGMKTLIEEMRR